MSLGEFFSPTFERIFDCSSIVQEPSTYCFFRPRFACVFSCKNDENVVEEINAPLVNYPLNEQRHANIIYSDSGINILEIDAALVQDYGNMEPPYVFFGGGLNVRFYNGPEMSSTVMTADTAHQDKKSDLWAIGGNVIVRNGKGERMLTELLFWIRKRNACIRTRR